MARASIIIPVYNKEKYLKETLLSVDRQQEDDLEIIIIDDNSTDHSMDIITDFSDNTRKQVKVIRNSQNMGVSYNRNLGVEESTSDYITFLDADDLLDNNFMNIMLEKSKKYPEADYIYGMHMPFIESISARSVHKMSEYFSYNEEEMIDPKFHTSFIARSNAACGARLYKKSSIKNLKFVESHFEDYEFFLDTIASELKCIYTTGPIYGYRVTGEGKYQTSLSSLSDSCLDYFTIYDRIEQKYPDMNQNIHNIIKERQSAICQGYLEKVLSNINMKSRDLVTFVRNYKRYLNVQYSYYDESHSYYMKEIQKLPEDPEILKQNIKKVAMKY